MPFFFPAVKKRRTNQVICFDMTEPITAITFVQRHVFGKLLCYLSTFAEAGSDCAVLCGLFMLQPAQRSRFFEPLG